jgi:F0F1-type ATP synthase membrane subunit c/vacuolar-type H+-ATPase subunit K
VALSWSGIKKPALFAKVFSIVFIGAILMESYFIGLEEIRASLALSFCKALSLLIFIFTLNVILKQSTLKKTKRSRMLVIIPFLIGDIYGVSLDIFMYFLYSEETLSLFTNLFIALIYSGGLTLLSYALSIWWAPKKEVFI